MTAQRSHPRARKLPPVAGAPAHQPGCRANLLADESPRPKGASERARHPVDATSPARRDRSQQPAAASPSPRPQRHVTPPQRRATSAPRAPSSGVIATRTRPGPDRRREECFLVQAEGAGLATVEARHLLALARARAQRTRQDAYALAWDMVAEAVLP